MYIRFFLFLIIPFLLVSCLSVSSKNQDGVNFVDVDEGIPQSSYQHTLDDDTRVELAKKRKSYLSGIRKGDFYSLRNAPEEALAYYLTALEKLPGDVVLGKKIAHISFLMKAWKRSFNQYFQVPLSELSETDKKEMIYALFYDDRENDRLGRLDDIFGSVGEVEYYRTIDACYKGIHECIVTLENYTGTDPKLLDLQAQIKNALQISDDVQYRNLLVAVKLYEQEMYRASERIALEILGSRADYMEVLKVRAFSLFELGEYENARKLLLQYLEKKPDDLETMIRIGESDAALGDLLSSNLYLNNVILAGYTPKIDLERQLIRNYDLLGDRNSVIKVLNYLVQEEQALEDDFAIAVSVALEEGKLSQAKSWGLIAMRKYPDSSLIGPLVMRTLRLNGEGDSALVVFDNASEDAVSKNPNYLLEKALVLQSAGRTNEAFLIFDSLRDLDEWPDIVAEAAREYNVIKEQKTESSDSTFKFW